MNITQVSLAEKMLPRLNLGKGRREVLATPPLLETQLKSYAEFLQEFVPADQRLNVGLHGALKSIFPIISYSGDAQLDYVGYTLGESMFNLNECKLRGLTYAAPLKVKMRLILRDKEASGDEKPIKAMKEQEVYMGDIPLMTPTGSLIINGTERVVVSQLHRSPGVYLEHDKGKTHSSGKLLYSARVIPYRGSWLDFEFDPKDALFVRIDRRRKLPATVVLRSLGFDTEQILELFYQNNELRLTNDGAILKLVPQRLRGELAVSDIKDKSGAIIVEANRRISARHIRQIEKAGIAELAVPD